METKKAAPVLQYYTVKIDGTVPVYLEYKVLAESEEQALKKVNDGNQSPITAKPNFSKLRKIGSKVYRPNSNLITLTQKY